MTREEILQIAKPILFNTDMVRATLDDRKTTTRRLVKPRYWNDEFGFRVVTNKDTSIWYLEKTDESEMGFDTPRYINPPYQIDDILYVRETWCNANKPGCEPDYYYFADIKYCEDYDSTEWIWKPSIHMPKEAARIFLRVTDVRVERLQDITNEQILKEGISKDVVKHYANQMPEQTPEWERGSYVIPFSELWDSTVKKKDLDKYSWEANPWVWVNQFERVEV